MRKRVSRRAIEARERLPRPQNRDDRERPQRHDRKGDRELQPDTYPGKDLVQIERGRAPETRTDAVPQREIAGSLWCPTSSPRIVELSIRHFTRHRTAHYKDSPDTCQGASWVRGLTRS